MQENHIPSLWRAFYGFITAQIEEGRLQMASELMRAAFAC